MEYVKLAQTICDGLDNDISEVANRLREIHSQYDWDFKRFKMIILFWDIEDSTVLFDWIFNDNEPKNFEI